MGTVRGQIPVRGKCAAGHTTETTSDKGRVTWEGLCADPGCGLKVKARRIPTNGEPPSSSTATKPKKSATSPYKVTEVSYDDAPQPQQQPGGADPGDGGGGAPPVQPAPVVEGADTGAGDGTPTGESGERPQPRDGVGRWKRRRRRLTRDERRAARAAAAEKWVVPNVVPRR